MTISTWHTFLVATILLCFSPGPGALSSMSAGMKYGWRRGMWNCIGMQVSIMVNATIIALGPGAVLMALRPCRAVTGCVKLLHRQFVG